MNLDNLSKEELRIFKRTWIECVDLDKKADPITDGLFNPEKYIESSPRILWILKEPYCDGNERKGGGWRLNDDEKSDDISRWRAFQPICYINYGIWSNEHDWNDMPWLRESEKIRKGLKKIGFINIGKLPGLTYSPRQWIVDAYEKNRTLILDQIKTYDPNLIFACDPHLSMLLKDLAPQDSKWTDFNTASCVRISAKQKLVRVNHPAARRQRRDYVNDAIKAAISDSPIV